MIRILGKVANSAIIKEKLSLEGLSSNIIDKMVEFNTFYDYESFEQLNFEIQLRVSCVNASRELNQSDFSFEVFRKSKCNELFWNRTSEGGFLLKEQIKASDAINNIFIDSSKYATECATAIVIIFYKATLEVLGDHIFDNNFPSIQLMNWHYIDKEIGIYSYKSKTPSLPGDCVYFKNPQVNPLTPEWQGENTINLGDDTYYGHGIGIKNEEGIITTLNENRKAEASKPAFLSNSVTTIDFVKLSRLLITKTIL